MKYEILYQSAFPAVLCELERGESIKAESDAMIAMSATLDVTGITGRGGLWEGAKRKFLAGESFFLQRITASRGPGKVLFAHAAPGGIADVELDGTYGLRVRREGFLAAEESIEMDTELQSLPKAVVSGEGFFLLGVKGKGTVFLSSFGAVHQISLDDGEEAVIDNGHLVAWPDCMEWKVEKASSEGWISSMTSGEGFVFRFTGPGTVLVQTRKPEAFSAWMKSMIKMVK